MCGIAGIYHHDRTKPVDRRVLEAMTECLRHRGPDDAGYYEAGGTGLGMRRLSVIDVAGGHQPQQNEAGDCRIVFNGEIYNYQELREQCLQRGHRFATASDTETILHLYEDDGADCVDPLNGMFAFALYDARSHGLLLARDRLGIKPLFYAEIDAGLVFASEIAALLLHPSVQREVDPVGLDHYLAYKYVPGPRTIYKHIRKLLPGHTLQADGGRLVVTPYWKLSFARRGPDSAREATEELRRRLREAVRRQMIADVPLGALLSGGIDSGLIVALMSEVSDRRVKTFSIGFEEQSYNELPSARLVAERYGTDHTELVVRPDIRDLFHEVVTRFGEPFGDSSAIPTFLVSQLARQHVTVALSGTGGDELFAGYERYWAIPLGRAYAGIPGPARRLLQGLLRAVPSGHGKRSLVHRGRRFVESATEDPIHRHQRIVNLFSVEERRRLYTEDWQTVLDADEADPLEQRYEASDADSELHRLLDVDTGSLLVDDYLVKDDRMSMAVSLELRVPLLDHTVVEFVAGLPPGLKLRGLTSKYLLRRLAGDYLPARILNRPKHGFEMPVARWLASDLKDLVRDLLTSPEASSRGILCPEEVDRLITEHGTGQANHSRKIWSLMTLEHWHRTHASGTRLSGCAG